MNVRVRVSSGCSLLASSIGMLADAERGPRRAASWSWPLASAVPPRGLPDRRVQIIVYAGAIMVLFLFVIMLLGVDRARSCSSLFPPADARVGLGALLTTEILWRLRGHLIGNADEAPGGFDAGRPGQRRGDRAGAVQRYLLPVRGDVDPAGRRRRRRDGARRRMARAVTAGGARAMPDEGVETS